MHHDEQRLLRLRRRSRVQNYVCPQSEAALSSIHGIGLFAREVIETGETVAVWGGFAVTEAELAQMLSGGVWEHVVEIAPGFYLARSREDDWDAADHINHSCSPNCRLVGRHLMVASRSIATGEELTADFSRAGGKRDFLCRCGSDRCLGRVACD